MYRTILLGHFQILLESALEKYKTTHIADAATSPHTAWKRDTIRYADFQATKLPFLHAFVERHWHVIHNGVLKGSFKFLKYLQFHHIQIPHLVEYHITPFVTLIAPTLAITAFHNVRVQSLFIMFCAKWRLPTSAAKRSLLLVARTECRITFAHHTIHDIRITHAVLVMDFAMCLFLSRPSV